MATNANPPPKPELPPGFKLIYSGTPLPAFYAAEMLRPLIGKTVYVRDSGGRTRQGELAKVPNVKEDAEGRDPATFLDEKPLYLRQIVCIAVYQPPQ